MRCEYCGAEVNGEDEGYPVCFECDWMIKKGEYGTCCCGHPLDPRGMCTAPLSAAD
jgi:hypothetical protein